MTGHPPATLKATDSAFEVKAYEKIDYSLVFVDGAFAVESTELADSYRPWKRCLMIVDETVHGLYGEQIRAYFDHHGIAVTAFPVAIGETAKTLRTVERIVDAFGEFGLVRKEPGLVVGGGLTTDVAGFACSVFRRSSAAGEFADQAVKVGARAVWFQLGVIDAAAFDRTVAAGVPMVMDTCPAIEWRKR